MAIDFGTTYSGYAFSFTDDKTASINVMRKFDGGGDTDMSNNKTPTTLLLDPHFRFRSFGFKARQEFHNLDDKEAKRYYYFEKFKMTLHSTQHLSRSTQIKAANGKSVPAITVFAHALRAFKDQALEELTDQSCTDINNDDVRWVVTVPAIWKQPAKQFMRNAAYEAGMGSERNPDQLIIALEPEAASVYCRGLRINQLIGTDNSRQGSTLNMSKMGRDVVKAVEDQKGNLICMPLCHYKARHAKRFCELRYEVHGGRLRRWNCRYHCS